MGKSPRYPEPVPIMLTGDEEEDRANARLVAVAPDLLKALQGIITYVECAPRGGDMSLLYELYHAAKAAIAAATEEVQSSI